MKPLLLSVVPCTGWDVLKTRAHQLDSVWVVEQLFEGLVVESSEL